MNENFFFGTFGVLMLVAIGVSVFLTLYVARLMVSFFSSRRKQKTSGNNRRKELRDLLESHAAERKAQPKKERVAYATLATDKFERSDDELESRSRLGRNIGYFVFATTSPPLIIPMVLLVVFVVLLIVSIINLYTFQSSLIPADHGLGFLALIGGFIPSSILAGLSMLPFGYRSKFKFGTCELVLAIISAGLVWCPFIVFAFTRSFETRLELLAYGYFTYISGFACFGALYCVCSWMGLVTFNDASKTSHFVPSGNWPKVE